MGKVGNEEVKTAVDSMDIDTAAIVVDIAAIETLITPKILTFYDAAVKTASENATGQQIDDFRIGLLTVNVTAVSGTSPTLVVTVETSEDNVTYFHSATLTDKEREGSLTRLTAPTDEAKITTVSEHVLWIDRLSKYIRLVLTIAGTTPSFTLTAKVTLYA